MLSYSCQQGQTLLDVCLNTYGSLDFLEKLITDNGFENANQLPTSGQIVSWDETLISDFSVYRTNTAFSVVYSTAERDAVSEQENKEFSNEFSIEFN